MGGVMKNFVKLYGLWFEYDNETPLSCARVFDDDFQESFYFDIQGCEITQAETKEELDWNDTIILNNKLRTGWLSPEGRFYGCKEYQHGMQAKIIHNKDEFSLEKEGWIRINYDYDDDREKFLTAGFSSNDETVYPTNEQLKYLLKNYKDYKSLYYNMWKVANERKRNIREEWGIYD